MRFSISDDAIEGSELHFFNRVTIERILNIIKKLILQ